MEQLWDPELRNEILMVDGAREVMGIGLNSLYYSLNDRNIRSFTRGKGKTGFFGT